MCDALHAPRGLLVTPGGKPWSTVDPAAVDAFPTSGRGGCCRPAGASPYIMSDSAPCGRGLLDIGSCRGYPFLPEWPASGPARTGRGADRGKAACSYGARRRCAGAGWSQLCVRVRLHPRLVVAEGPAAVEKSGNWLLFDLSTPAAFQESLTEFGVALTDEQAACGSEAYAAVGPASLLCARYRPCRW